MVRERYCCVACPHVPLVLVTAGERKLAQLTYVSLLLASQQGLSLGEPGFSCTPVRCHLDTVAWQQTAW